MLSMQDLLTVVMISYQSDANFDNRKYLYIDLNTLTHLTIFRFRTSQFGDDVEVMFNLGGLYTYPIIYTYIHIYYIYIYISGFGVTF